jgi:glycerol-3-phosphate dehydrogenase
LLVSIGGKLTSARADAGSLVDRALRDWGRPVGLSPTAERPFPWCPEEPFEEWLEATVRRSVGLGLDRETAASCALRYGSRVDRVLEHVESSPGLARRIVPDAPFCLAEAVHAIREEMAITLEDVLRRRIPLTLLCRVCDESLQEVASLVGRELDWTEEQRRREVQDLLSNHQLDTAAP